MAKAVPGATKYGGGVNNFLEVKDLKVKGSIAEDLAEAVRHSITKKTWASYRTAERMLAKYMKENGVKMELPVEEGTLLGFIHWLAYIRKKTAQLQLRGIWLASGNRTSSRELRSRS